MSARLACALKKAKQNKKNSRFLIQRQDMAGSGCSLVEVDLMVDGSLAVEEGGQDGGRKK